MARKLEYSKLSLRDLDQMRRWLNQPGAGRRAKARARRIAAAVRELQSDPVKWPKGEEPGTRERVVERHVIVYSAQPDTNDRLTAGDGFVIRVCGPGRERP
jgi:plasmid stabilization system protein ParE